MLLRFTLSNFFSFKNEVTVSLEAGGIKEYTHNLFVRSNIKLLKSIGLFGPNASGKSNFLKAFSFVRSLVLNSSREGHYFDNFQFDTFRLDSSSENRPSTFQIQFLIDNDIYDFKFSASSKKIYEESLMIIQKGKPEVVYVRSNDQFEFGRTINKNHELKNQLKILIPITRTNALFITILSQFNVEFGKQVCNWFSRSKIIFDANNQEIINYTAALLTNREYYQLINNIINTVDLGFTKVRSSKTLKKISTIPNYQFISEVLDDLNMEYEVLTTHKKFNSDASYIENVDFNLMINESLGTQKYFGLLGPIIESLKQGSLIFIDELDSRFHPLLLLSLLRLFNSEVTNPKGAQMIFTSHNTLPLKEILRRDQMFFVSKDNIGSSDIQSLYSKDPKIRKDASFEKDYLQGEFGSIPKIGNQLDLFNDIF